MKKILVISVVALFAIVGCKKYEDGPTISLATKKARLVNTWKLDKEFINDEEQTLSSDDKDDYFEVKKDGSYIRTTVSGSISTTANGTWEFDSKKENILVKFTTNTILGQTTVTYTYKILRLKSNELWVEYTGGNNTIKYYYVTK